MRMEIGWPPGVPFVHPHDLPNKAKMGFLEAYEPGWTTTHDMDLSLLETGQAGQHSTNCNCNFHVQVLHEHAYFSTRLAVFSALYDACSPLQIVAV